MSIIKKIIALSCCALLSGCVITPGNYTATPDPYTYEQPVPVPVPTPVPTPVVPVNPTPACPANYTPYEGMCLPPGTPIPSNGGHDFVGPVVPPAPTPAPAPAPAPTPTPAPVHPTAPCPSGYTAFKGMCLPPGTPTPSGGGGHIFVGPGTTTPTAAPVIMPHPAPVIMHAPPRPAPVVMAAPHPAAEPEPAKKPAPAGVEKK